MGDCAIGHCDTMAGGDLISERVGMTDYIADSSGVLRGLRRPPGGGDGLRRNAPVEDFVSEPERVKETFQLVQRDGDSREC